MVEDLERLGYPAGWVRLGFSIPEDLIARMPRTRRQNPAWH